MGYIIGAIIILGILLGLLGGLLNGVLEGGGFVLSKILSGGELRFGIFFLVCAIACTLLSYLFSSPTFLFLAKVFIFLIVLLVVIYLGKIIFRMNPNKDNEENL